MARNKDGNKKCVEPQIKVQTDRKRDENERESKSHKRGKVKQDLLKILFVSSNEPETCLRIQNSQRDSESQVPTKTMIS